MGGLDWVLDTVEHHWPGKERRRQSIGVTNPPTAISSSGSRW
jgi:hypothetical protein